MEGRYRKKSFGKIFLKRIIVTLLIAFTAHCAIYGIFLKLKMPFFRRNDAAAHSKLTEEIKLCNTLDENELRDAFRLYYPGYDYGHSGIEQTGLVLDCGTKKILASDDFTLPENKLLAEYLDSPEKYKAKMEETNRTLKYGGESEKTNLFGFERCEVSPEIYAGGKSVLVMTVTRVNFYAYFLKYLFPADIVLFCAAVSAALALTFQKNKVNFEDEYRRTIINSLSHDLKTPLTIISGCAENLKENVDPEKREFYENAIIENAKYTESIINDALELTRSEKKADRHEFSKTEIRPLIEELWKKYKVPSSEKNITLNISGNTVLNADRKMTAQLLENLISNAVKYADDNSQIDISLTSKTMTVSNSFSGKITTDPDRLCEPFVRGTSERSGRNGSGVGLAIVSNIVKAHKYKMNIEIKDRRFTVNIKVK